MCTGRPDGPVAHLERVRLSKRDFPTAISECVETVSLDTRERDEQTVPETKKDTGNYGWKPFYPSNQNSSKKIFMTDTQFVCQLQIPGHTERLSLRGIACFVGYLLPPGSEKCHWQDPPVRSQMDNQLPASPVGFVSVAGTTSDETMVSSARTSLLESSNLESVYEDLRNLASWLIRSEKNALSLEEVDLVHESYLRLTKSSETLSFQSRKQLINLLVTTMRRVLIDHAKQKATEKRGGNLRKVSMEGIDLSDNRSGADQRQELLDLNAALDRLAGIHSQSAQIVKLRIFAGLTFDEISELLGDSRSSIYRQWMVARAWLKAEVDPLANADGAR